MTTYYIFSGSSSLYSTTASLRNANSLVKAAMQNCASRQQKSAIHKIKVLLLNIVVTQWYFSPVVTVDSKQTFIFTDSPTSQFNVVQNFPKPQT